MVNGTETVHYPFLHDNNEKDRHLALLLYQDKPYVATYGDKNKEWEVFATTLLNVKDKNGSLLYYGLSWRSIKNRFEKLMIATRQIRANLMKQTGQDDQPQCLLLETLEKILVEYDDQEKGNENKKQADATKKLKDRLAADMIKQASLRTFIVAGKKGSSSELTSDKENDEALPMTPVDVKKRAPRVTPPTRTSKIDQILLAKEGKMKYRQQILSDKERRKMLKLEKEKEAIAAQLKIKEMEVQAQREIELKKIELEEKKLAFEREKLEAQTKAQAKAGADNNSDMLKAILESLGKK